MYELYSYQVAGEARKDDAVREPKDESACVESFSQGTGTGAEPEPEPCCCCRCRDAMRCNACSGSLSLGFGFGAKMVQLIDAGGRFKRVAAPWG